MALCECGCGAETSLAPYNWARRGWVKGQPLRFVRGHSSSTNLHNYLIEDRGYETPCWVWQGYLTREGYARSFRDRKAMLIHRWLYEQQVAPIPDGHDLHHRCEVTACVNPAHMKPVTKAEHARLSWWANRTHCCRGHEYTPENTYYRPAHSGMGRYCRACDRVHGAARRARLRAEKVAS